FPYKATHNPPVTEFTYAIPLGDWEPGDELYLAAHAVVKLFEGGEVVQEETGWGEGEKFPKSWAMWFKYEVQECCCPLPHGDQHIYFRHTPSGESYWTMTFEDVEEGYALRNLTYLGWCVDQYITIGQGWHDFPVYCSHAPNLPLHLQDDDWDMVGWVINHKHPQASMMDIQQAVWYFVNGGIYPTDPQAIAMVEDALANGEGFVPAYCQFATVIIDGGNKKQSTIIEMPACGAICCEVLPQGDLDVYLKYPAPNSYWEMTYKNIPDGF
ncbi:unnamed protein product, partial [marine sediment metagenome]